MGSVDFTTDFANASTSTSLYKPQQVHLNVLQAQHLRPWPSSIPSMWYHHACSQEPHGVFSSTAPFQLTTVQHKWRRAVAALLCWRSLTGSPLLFLQRLLTSQNVRGFLSLTCGAKAIELQLVTSPQTILGWLLGCPDFAWPNSGLLLCSRFLLLVVGSVSRFLTLHAAPAPEPLGFYLLLGS